MFLQSWGKQAVETQNPAQICPLFLSASRGKQGQCRAGSRGLVKRVQAGGIGEGRDSLEIHVFLENYQYFGKKNAAF